MSRLESFVAALPRVVAQMAIWPLLGFLTIAFDDLGPSLAPSLPPGSELYVFMQWGLLTPFVVFLARRFPLIERRPRNVAVHVLAAFVLCGLRVIEEPFRVVMAARVPAQEFLAYALSRDLLVYASIVTATHLFLLARRSSSAEREALIAEAKVASAERQLLESSVAPEIIVRTLDEIARRIRHEPARVQPLIEIFSDFLRSGIPLPPQEARPRFAVEVLERELGARSE